MAGQVLPDMPPYWQEGWLQDSSPEQQAGLDFRTEMYPAGLDGRLQ